MNTTSIHTSTWLDFKKWWAKELREEKTPGALELYEHHPVMTATASMTEAVIGIIDTQTMRYSYLSPNMSTWTGWNREDYEQGGVEFVYSTVLPADREGLVTISERIDTYFKNLQHSERKFFRAYWDFHLSNKQGYFRILQQSSALKYDENGNIEELLFFVTRIHNIIPPGSQHLRITNGVENIFYKYDHKLKKLFELEPLTARELEIAELIAQSMTLKEIAGRLHIRFNTVKVHSANMIEKLQVKNSIEMVNLLQTWDLFRD